jgi:putative YhdH/YhfP family quinone oxidoreductase
MTLHAPRPGWKIYERDGEFVSELAAIHADRLPDHDTLIEVRYSSLNYKDVLSWSGHKGVTRNYPHTPGVDAAGVIVESAEDSLAEGDEVIVVGFDLGMNTPGGHGGWIRVPSEWVIRKPDGLSLQECMTIGTAGFTAAQSLHRFEQMGLAAGDGEVVVTGATGGVGSVAVSLLAQSGYEVAACTRQESQTDWLKCLGAERVIAPEDVRVETDRPLVQGRWAGAVDTVGGALLESILRSTRHRGVVTCCGMIGGAELNTSIFPFILRGVTLAGIDSAECPMAIKKEIWHRLSTEWKPARLEDLQTVVPLSELLHQVGLMRDGQTRGRVVIEHAN